MADSRPVDTQVFRLALTVPCDARFRAIPGVLCELMVRSIGYSESESSQIVAAVTHMTDGLVVRAEYPHCKDLGITIVTNESEIEFRVRYLRGDESLAGDIKNMSHLFTEDSGGGSLDAICSVMGRVEFGEDSGVEYCAMSKSLPEKPSSSSLQEFISES